MVKTVVVVPVQFTVPSEETFCLETPSTDMTLGAVAHTNVVFVPLTEPDVGCW